MKRDKADQKQYIFDYLRDLGFEELAARLYVTLLQYGAMTILQASKQSHIERTKIYRLIDSLEAIGLLEKIIDYKRVLIKAKDLHSVRFLVDKKKSLATHLDTSFGTFSQAVQTIAHNSPSSEVLFYKGTEGIKQMLWNELSADNESLCYIYKFFDPIVGDLFFEHWAQEFGRRKLISREIRTEVFDQSYDAEKDPNGICFHMKNVEIRYLPTKIFPLNQGITIYNNVLAIYNWWHDEICGIEIYNQQIADYQKFVFESFWITGKPYTGYKHKSNINVK